MIDPDAPDPDIQIHRLTLDARALVFVFGRHHQYTGVVFYLSQLLLPGHFKGVFAFKVVV